MSILKTLPLAFEGNLHEVNLINFSIDPSELEGLVPPEVPVRLFDGRAMISLVNVQLEEMKPTFLPSFLSFNYRHVGFRLLVDDEQFTDQASRGIYFIRSFSNRTDIVAAGRQLSNYNLETAEISYKDQALSLKKGQQFLSYKLLPYAPREKREALREVTKKIDRAYAPGRGGLWMTKVLRISWPIEEVACSQFSTNFFKTARFEAAFRIRNDIRYHWCSPKLVKVKSMSTVGSVPKGAEPETKPFGLAGVS